MATTRRRAQGFRWAPLVLPRPEIAGASPVGPARPIQEVGPVGPIPHISEYFDSPAGPIPTRGGPPPLRMSIDAHLRVRPPPPTHKLLGRIFNGPIRPHWALCISGFLWRMFVSLTFTLIFDVFVVSITIVEAKWASWRGIWRRVESLID